MSFEPHELSSSRTGFQPMIGLRRPLESLLVLGSSPLLALAFWASLLTLEPLESLPALG